MLMRSPKLPEAPWRMTCCNTFRLLRVARAKLSMAYTVKAKAKMAKRPKSHKALRFCCSRASSSSSKREVTERSKAMVCVIAPVPAAKNSAGTPLGSPVPRASRTLAVKPCVAVLAAAQVEGLSSPARFKDSSFSSIRAVCKSISWA